MVGAQKKVKKPPLTQFPAGPSPTSASAFCPTPYLLHEQIPILIAMNSQLESSAPVNRHTEAHKASNFSTGQDYSDPHGAGRSCTLAYCSEHLCPSAAPCLSDSPVAARVQICLLVVVTSPQRPRLHAASCRQSAACQLHVQSLSPLHREDRPVPAAAVTVHNVCIQLLNPMAEVQEVRDITGRRCRPLMMRSATTIAQYGPCLVLLTNTQTNYYVPSTAEGILAYSWAGAPDKWHCAQAANCWVDAGSTNAG